MHDIDVPEHVPDRARRPDLHGGTVASKTTTGSWRPTSRTEAGSADGDSADDTSAGGGGGGGGGKVAGSGAAHDELGLGGIVLELDLADQLGDARRSE